MGQTSFLWREITAKCQLRCSRCYASSSPSGTHGSMGRADWLRVLDQAVDLGVEMVQFIGGEPTLHPDLADLVDHALGRGLQVEVFSRPAVSLATSYYSDDPDQHAAVTGRPSYPRTRANIAEAMRRGIPLRAGVIDMGSGQRAEQAQSELVELGVCQRWATTGSARSAAGSATSRPARRSCAGAAVTGWLPSRRMALCGRACSLAGCR